jgi:GNAT superfamily N-acetyltransferase
MPIDVVRRRDPDAVRDILDSLPDWFGLPEFNARFVREAAVLPSYLAVEADDRARVVGVVLLAEHFPDAREVHLMAVRPEHHRQGVGRRLLAAVEEDLRSEGVRILEVHTLGPSYEDEEYARTREFYLAQGFVPIHEVQLADWEDDEPTLILVKPL